MDWSKVSAKLRATANQHAQDAENELMRGNKNNMERQHQLSQIFYGLHAAIEAGIEADDHS